MEGHQRAHRIAGLSLLSPRLSSQAPHSLDDRPWFVELGCGEPILKHGRGGNNTASTVDAKGPPAWGSVNRTPISPRKNYKGRPPTENPDPESFGGTSLRTHAEKSHFAEGSAMRWGIGVSESPGDPTWRRAGEIYRLATVEKPDRRSSPAGDCHRGSVNQGNYSDHNGLSGFASSSRGRHSYFPGHEPKPPARPHLGPASDGRRIRGHGWRDVSPVQTRRERTKAVAEPGLSGSVSIIASTRAYGRSFMRHNDPENLEPRPGPGWSSSCKGRRLRLSSFPQRPARGCIPSTA